MKLVGIISVVAAVIAVILQSLGGAAYDKTVHVSAQYTSASSNITVLAEDQNMRVPGLQVYKFNMTSAKGYYRTHYRSIQSIVAMSPGYVIGQGVNVTASGQDINIAATTSANVYVWIKGEL